MCDEKYIFLPCFSLVKINNKMKYKKEIKTNIY